MVDTIQKVIVIAGATATGKSDLAVELAKELGTEIISADSMQVYKYMDIGTAKPNENEMNGIKHYMINEINPDEPFSVAVYKEKAEAYIQTIHAKNKIPLIVGGTGFYINAILKSNHFTEQETDLEYRAMLFEIALREGNKIFHERLKDIDYESYVNIHCNNVKRVVRALEYHHTTNTKISEHNQTERIRQYAYDAKIFILDCEKSELYQRINKRVDKMMELGLLDEVKELYINYPKCLTSMQGIGYKEIIDYIDGQCSLEQTVDKIKQNSRNYAKRQQTWFKHQIAGNIYDIGKISHSEVKMKILSEVSDWSKQGH